MFGFDPVQMIIVIVSSVVGMLVSSRLKSKMGYYAQVPLKNGMTGADIANAMLRHYGIYDVEVLSTEGFLSDHYNPMNKTVNLSKDIFYGRSVAAAAVAAHECGHAVQHKEAYSMLQMRSQLVPIVNFSTTIQQFLPFAFMFAANSPLGSIVFLVMVIAFGLTALFSLVTLPVEFDASKRALVWLESTGTLRGEEGEGAKDALKWAAMTYVAAALSALAMFIYVAIRFLNARDRE